MFDFSNTQNQLKYKHECDLDYLDKECHQKKNKLVDLGYNVELFTSVSNFMNFRKKNIVDDTIST